jgi:simple sugar transport system permease protein
VPPIWLRLAFPVLALAGAGCAGAVLLLLTGFSPWTVYSAAGDAAFGTSLAWQRTLVSSTPLILTGLAAAVAFRMRIWNIGGEGQLYIGAIAASGVALAVADGLPSVIAIAVVLGAGALGGAVWAGLAAAPRARFGTDEVISTLMLNFIALFLMNYLIFGSEGFWRDKERLTYPTGRDIPESAVAPELWGRLHIGFLVAVAVAVGLWILLRSTRWGYTVRLVGDSTRAARYAGVRVPRRIASVLLLSGAAAGLAGAILIIGSLGSLEPRALAINLGYTGIIVAAVARLNPLAVVPVAVAVGGISSAGPALQTSGVPSELVLVLQGLALLVVAASELLMSNRIRFAPAAPAGAPSAAPAARR